MADEADRENGIARTGRGTFAGERTRAGVGASTGEGTRRFRVAGFEGTRTGWRTRAGEGALAGTIRAIRATGTVELVGAIRWVGRSEERSARERNPARNRAAEREEKVAYPFGSRVCAVRRGGVQRAVIGIREMRILLPRGAWEKRGDAGTWCSARGAAWEAWDR